ncbi:ubiquinol-cytochrome C reductase [Myxozyma melibiosi]|uniref:Complex III subunit 9 n=1 Tax=Myxozyma melibiosi TaxID=54550 RepID=A0ABR1F459_9ASCO
MAISSVIYNTIFRRNSIFVGTVLAGAFAFEIAFDSTVDKYWDARNIGKQWKDIKYKYVEKDEE